MYHGKNQHQHSRQYCYRRLRSIDCDQDLLMPNIWEDNMGEDNPGIEYKHLEDLIDFEGFSFDKWRTGEVSILEPQLHKLGYHDLVWSMGDFDSFGPLTRVCKAKNSSGEVVWFIYG